MNEGEPQVSIVVVSHQAREQLRCCLESMGGVDVPHQVIVVDDGSADGTSEMVRADHPQVELLSFDTNRGLPAGRNASLELIRAPKVLMIDSDTQLVPGGVEALVSRLDRNPDYGIVSPQLLNPDGSVQESCRRWPSPLIPLLRRGPYAMLNEDPGAHRHHMMRDFSFDYERPVVSTMGAAQMWRTDLPFRIGRFDTRISSYGGEDQDWCARCWRVGLKVVYVPDAEIVHNWQHVVRRQPWSRHSFLALRDFYYLQLKHRRIGSYPGIEEALA